MFGILLGRKFSNKCKHSVKYIKCRMEMIRKKKQAIVRYLKKDVADLLAGGHESNAFGRIDALIVEINHATCYDMIEQYCGCLLENLSTMCKERECPKEAMEAVATLIFAAARFSDLPELTVLRTIFTKRYGTRMESCIDKVFVEKIQKKSFSKARKLQLMEDIAQEFSVTWNSNMFDNKMVNQPAATHGKSVKHQPVIKENEKQFQTTPANANINEHDSTEKNVKMTAVESENAKSDYPDKKANFKAKYIQNKNYKNDSILEGNANSRSEMVHEGVGMNTKLTVGSNGSNLAHSEALECDHNASRRAFNSQPPYRKPNVNNNPNDTNCVNPTEYDKSTGGQGNKQKDDSNLVFQIQSKQGRESARTNDIHGVVHDEQRSIMKQTPSDRRRPGSRRTVETIMDDGEDKEEVIMDKLLMYYSKKGTNNEPGKIKIKMRRADAARVPEHLDQQLTSPAENGVKSRTRASSKHAERVHLRQPDNENLTGILKNGFIDTAA